VFENKVLSEIFAPRREVIERWRKLGKKERHNLYSSLNIKVINSRMMRWEGHVSLMGEIKNA